MRYAGEPGGRAYDIRYRLDRDGLTAEGFDGVRLVSAAADRVALEIDGVRRTFDIAVYPERTFVDSPFGSAALTVLPRFPDPGQSAAPGSLRATMPGTVVRTAGLTPGDRVEAGQPLLWLEAMKMEHVVAAPTAGTLLELTADVGRQVELGAVLAVVKEEREETGP